MIKLRFFTGKISPSYYSDNPSSIKAEILSAHLLERTRNALAQRGVQLLRQYFPDPVDTPRLQWKIQVEQGLTQKMPDAGIREDKKLTNNVSFSQYSEKCFDSVGCLGRRCLPKT